MSRRMQGGGSESKSKFAVYQNPALSAALTSNSPSASTFLFFIILSLSSASLFALFFIRYRGDEVAANLGFGYVSEGVASLCSQAMQTVACLVLIGNLLALFKVISQWRSRNIADVVVVSPSEGKKELTHLTNRQLVLLGLTPKVNMDVKESPKKTPKTNFSSPSSSNGLIPLHQPITGSSHSSKMSGGKSSGGMLHTFTTPSKSPASPSMYLVPTTSTRSPASAHSPALQTSFGANQFVSTPWSNKRSAFHKELSTEEELETFLADVDDKISATLNKLATPPPSINGFGVASPNTISSSVNTSGTTRSTPLRPVRMSPASQKFTTPPKKGEGDLPPAMSIEESIDAFEKLGIYPHIEHWRDRLRQWFSAVLLNPLLSKIETSHLKVMEAAAKINTTITISQVGSTEQSTPTINVSPLDRTNEWKPALAADEDGLLLQLRASLVQALDACVPKLPISNFQQSPQHAALVPVLQECIDAITEHQRLHALMRGEWCKGLLSQSGFRADYTVQRICSLAKGTCVKNYEHLGNGEVNTKANKNWSVEFLSDSHLLLYLFCAFLEHPKWMLHVDPATYTGVQSSKNPLFLGALPPKEQFPENYIAIVSGVPSVLHPGACILAVGKQSPPVFVLYWDKKPQFSLQGRTALWDSILLLCYKIKCSYGGVVRGMHLGSTALSILPVLEEETDD